MSLLLAPYSFEQGKGCVDETSKEKGTHYTLEEVTINNHLFWVSPSIHFLPQKYELYRWHSCEDNRLMTCQQRYFSLLIMTDSNSILKFFHSNW